MRSTVEAKKVAIMSEFENTKSRGNLLASSEMVSAMSERNSLRPQTASIYHKKKGKKKHFRAKSAQATRMKQENRFPEPFAYDDYVNQDFDAQLNEEAIGDKIMPPGESPDDPSTISADGENHKIRPQTARQSKSIPFNLQSNRDVVD